MPKKKKSQKRKNNKKNYNKKSIFIISFCVLIFLGGIGYLYTKNVYNTNGRVEYYTGGYDTIAYAANLLDMVNSKDNVLISPYNINTNLAYIYNGTDNDSRKEIKSYFDKDVKKLNNAMANKIDIIEVKGEKTEFDLLYEKLMNDFFNNGYDEFTLNSINGLNSDGKKNMQLLLKKMLLTYDRINEKNDVSVVTIENYLLSAKEIVESDYVLKSLLDKVLSNTEEFLIGNNVKNYMGLYTKELSNEEVNDSFKKNTMMYNVNINKDYQVSDVNTKLKETTKDKIKRINNQKIFDKELIMVNSLYFDYTWEMPFTAGQVQDSVFYSNDGKYSAVQMMYSEESNYIENEYVRGFIKYFKDKKYSFVGLLPKKSDDFKLSEINVELLIKKVKKKNILIGLPKFEIASEIDLKKLHEKMGIEEIYSNKANFKVITDKKIKIDENIQKTAITIGEKGISNSKVVPDNIETFTYADGIDSIIFDHPFIFLIISNETNDVILIGRVNKV